jgi:hypothetical protein
LDGFADLFDLVFVPSDVYMDLWPRLRAWLQFVNLYCDHIPERFRPTLTRERGSAVGSTIILAVEKHPLMSNIIRKSPGTRAILTTYWATILQNDEMMTQKLDRKMELTERHRICSAILLIISDDARDEHNFDELVDDAGGSQAGLAYLLVKQVSDFAGPGLSDLTALTLTTVISIIAVGASKDEDDPLNRHCSSTALARPLRALSSLSIIIPTRPAAGIPPLRP